VEAVWEEELKLRGEEVGFKLGVKERGSCGCAEF